MEKSISKIRDLKIQIQDLRQASRIRNTALMRRWIRIGIRRKVGSGSATLVPYLLAQKLLQQFKHQGGLTMCSNVSLLDHNPETHTERFFEK
jgi:hypothetical protein